MIQILPQYIDALHIGRLSINKLFCCLLHEKDASLVLSKDTQAIQIIYQIPYAMKLTSHGQTRWCN